MPADFDKQEYWHARFATETNFEWLASSEEFMRILEADADFARHLTMMSKDNNNNSDSDSGSSSNPSHSSSSSSSSSRILHVGFGTSDLQNHLRAAGFARVLNVDYEPLAVERGRQLEGARFRDVRMGYAVADATRLDVDLGLAGGEGDGGGVQVDGQGRGRGRGEGASGGPGRFDIVVDKSTADAVSCGGEGPLLSMCRAVRRCLAPGGFWVSLSHSRWRFDVDGLPFRCEEIARIPTRKLRETDPDIYHYCYKLKPRGDGPGAEW